MNVLLLPNKLQNIDIGSKQLMELICYNFTHSFHQNRLGRFKNGLALSCFSLQF